MGPSPTDASEHRPDAGLWLRAAAALLDAAIAMPLAVAAAIATATAWAALQRAVASHASGRALPEVVAAAVGSVLWLYHATAECSRRQATVGKRALGLRVVDRGGGRIRFGRASARTFAKLLSTVPLLGGFALAACTPSRRALHDLLASTRVVADRPRRVGRAAAVLLTGAALAVAVACASVRQFERAQEGARAARARAALSTERDASPREGPAR
jgi:uncharacterized RDD family membrane protein YckC